jgi:hypothetical protein
MQGVQVSAETLLKALVLSSVGQGIPDLATIPTTIMSHTYVWGFNGTQRSLFYCWRLGRELTAQVACTMRCCTKARPGLGIRNAIHEQSTHATHMK